MSVHCFAAAPASLAPIRVVAAIALAAVIGAFIYVLRHIRKIRGEIIGDNLVPASRGPRNNMILMTCAITFVISSLLLFLIVKG